VLILAIGRWRRPSRLTTPFLLICGLSSRRIGGDYPVSATIMSEYSASSRAGDVGLVFAMQGAGLIVAAGGLHSARLGISDDYVRRSCSPSALFPAWPFLPAAPDSRDAQVRDGRRADEAEAAIAAAAGAKSVKDCQGVRGPARQEPWRASWSWQSKRMLWGSSARPLLVPARLRLLRQHHFVAEISSC